MLKLSAHETISLLPKNLTNHILCGSCGELHLSSLAEAGLATVQDSPQLMQKRLTLYADILLAAWEQKACGDPGLLLQLDQMLRFLHPLLRDILTAKRDTIPDDMLMDAEALTRASLPAALRMRLLGDCHRMRGDIEHAAALYSESVILLPLAETVFRLADAYAITGNKDLAIGSLVKHLELRPWSVHGLLRLHDIALGLDQPAGMPEGNGAILLYTWNHAEHLDATLHSLFESDAGTSGIGITILDNGSSDNTPEVLRAWKERAGDQLSVHVAPVNVGAPAARNWLLNIPEIISRDWVAFSDDDVILPPDWLGHFGTAMRAYPEGGVFGARVVSHSNPCELQSVDLHLMDGDNPALPAAPDSGRSSFVISDMHHQLADFGTFSYMRPCASVTGCVHLFRMDALKKAGPFSLAFSPSQYDDAEHDLRMCLQGNQPIYTGHLCIRHMQRSSKDATRTRTANVLGNFFKLQTLYSQNEIAEIQDMDTRIAEKDLRIKESMLTKYFADRNS
ncbi:GT2 family glycosyltransferase [Desulfomicrobium macestii]|uniref:GT2 family glycosyltransferase n=1 Tax=Desulfomicrobium macestii TaxID=90731 RepID=A0ABR9H9K7_9BACT|nr:glycosyltransferase family 2 protein [Desulfomicrobium macestii]MBE1427426.1 GT2 family glycosyltransferase [Desulfomicrobium macestii]